MQFEDNSKKQRWTRGFLYSSVPLLLLCITGCTYPTALLFNKEALPASLGQKWTPKKRSIRTSDRIQYAEPIDPNIVKGPLSLAQVVDFSLRNNPSTAMSWANILGSIADLGLARKDYFPKVTVQGNIQRQQIGSPFSVQGKASNWLTLGGTQGTLSYTLWDFGAREAKSESALQALFAMSYAYNQELQTVIQEVTNDYYNFLYQKAAFQDRVRDVEDSALLLQAAEKKLKLGIANITDLVQAKTTYLNSQVAQVSQKDNKENALVNLAKNMGMAGNIQFQTQNFPCELPGEEFLVQNDVFIELALQNRPDLIRYKAEILSHKAALTQARLEPLPKLTGNLDLQYTAYHGFRDAFDMIALFKLEMDFFDGFSLRNKTRIAKAKLKEALANFKKQQDLILAEVTTYYNNYKNTVEKVEYTQEYLDAAYEEFEVTLGNYKAGTGDILNVVQALSSLSNARSKFTLSIKELFSSLTNLAYATGSLIAPSEDSDWEGIYQFSEDPN